MEEGRLNAEVAEDSRKALRKIFARRDTETQRKK